MRSNAVNLDASLSRPLGVPPHFLLDAVARARGTDEAMARCMDVVHEFRTARGYALPWGQVVERTDFGTTVWVIVPVSMWQELADARHGSALGIPDLTAACHRVVRSSLHGQLPDFISLTGCQGGRRLRPHGLLSLALSTGDCEPQTRAWIVERLLQVLLPRTLAECEAYLRQLLTSAYHRRELQGVTA